MKKNIRLSVLIEHGVPATLIGDPLRLSQVLINLSSNAVKFSGDGDTVSLKIFLMEKSNDDVVLRFSVEDTGIGLSKEQQKKLFTAFSQADSSTTRKYGGSGLGLVISKKFVQMMDGEIDVDSELGVGSTFSFTARLGIQQAGQAAQETSSDKNNDDELASQAINHLRGAKILVVEDNVLNQELILELLTMNGLNVQVAHNGKEALELIAREDFDGVLMDCQMPIMDGYEATRKIREQQKYKFLPIIAMTANTMSGDREITLKSGMNDYIAKPIKASTMFIVMGKWITPGKE